MPTVINKSTILSDDDVRRMVAACDRQVKDHFVPAHDGLGFGWTLTFEKPAYIHIYVVDEDTSVDGALAYHDYDGRPVGVVLADTIRRYARDVDWKFGRDGVSVALSHEYLEILLDPYCDRLGDRYWLEACDAVQGYSYPIGDDVYVSDFCTKYWWTKGSPGPWDYMKLLSAPQQLGTGGYQVHYNTDGGTTVHGDKPPYHGWRALSR